MPTRDSQAVELADLIRQMQNDILQARDNIERLAERIAALEADQG